MVVDHELRLCGIMGHFRESGRICMGAVVAAFVSKDEAVKRVWLWEETLLTSYEGVIVIEVLNYEIDIG
jgi:hypothetical protein